MTPDLLVAPTALVARVREVHRIRLAADTELMQLACAWADSHPDLDPETPSPDDPSSAELDPAIPAVDWSAGASFAAALGLSTAAGDAMIRDALVLRHRLPRVWARVEACEVPVWRARRIAERALARPDDVVAHLDAAVAPVAEKVGPGTLDRLLDEAMLLLHPEERELAQLEALDARYVRLHPETLTDTAVADLTIRGDWHDLCEFDATIAQLAAALAATDETDGCPADSLDVRRSRAVGVLADPAAAVALLSGAAAPAPSRRLGVMVHLTPDQLAGLDPVCRAQGKGGDRAALDQVVRAWCGRTDTHLTVTGVIDLTEHAGVDHYEVRGRMRDRVTAAHTSCVFPWCTRAARFCDCDHTVPYASGGHTCDCNLAPLCRRHHRLKTHAGWRYRLIETGGWLWTDPHGQSFLRDRLGTRDLDPPVDASGCRRLSPADVPSRAA